MERHRGSSCEPPRGGKEGDGVLVPMTLKPMGTPQAFRTVHKCTHLQLTKMMFP